MKKNLLLFGLLVVALAVIYFFNRLPFSVSKPVKTSVSPSAGLILATPGPTALPTPTPVWKTYKNQKLGFSFSYPTGSNFSMETLKQETPEQLLYLHFYNGGIKSESYISIEVYTGDNTLLPPGPTPEVAPEAIIGYNRRTINTVSYEEYLLNGPCLPHTLQTVRNNRTYIFQDICGPVPEFDQLVNSVRYN